MQPPEALESLIRGIVCRREYVSTDAAWGRIGHQDPYFGVFTAERFHGGGNKDEFFRSGELHVDRVFASIRELVPEFAPKRAVDFGCGVGRLVIPLSQRCREVVGIDISAGMLAETRLNCDSRGITNVTLLRSSQDLTGSCDFVHSFHVFQHIPASRGLELVQALVDRLEDDGIGALHFLYRSRRSAGKRLLYPIYRLVPGATMLANVVRGRRANLPLIQMNPYPLDRILDVLQTLGCHRIGGYLTDQGGGHLGIVLIFQRRRLPPPY